MFDRDTPEYLQSRLETFIQHWHGHREPIYGIDPKKLAETELPAPLKWLYGFAGEWPGAAYWDTLFGIQDCLSAFECLRIEDGKLVFLHENQGVWWLGTDTTGNDPAVYVNSGSGWSLVDESLTRFLVTFILHETAIGCDHTVSDDQAIHKLEQASQKVVPLWLNHPYPWVENPVASMSFYVSGGYLVMCRHDSQWCGTCHHAPWEQVPDLFPFREPQSESTGLDPYEPIPDHLQLPALIKRSHLRQVVHRHQQKVDYHSWRVQLYQKMLDDIPDDAR